MIEVSFQHWRYVFLEEELVRYGSPYFDPATTRSQLLPALETRASETSRHRISFDPAQILCANEAFPEAAVADPLSDLEIWDEWQSGIRAFPYPGRFSRLGITQQKAKAASTSSIGVIGEIMAGLYAQAGIAPWVLVRVIRRWPDFIFYTPGDRYAFVEAKAYTQGVNGKTGLRARVPDVLLGEALIDAIRQLNADAFVKVWSAFTYIESVAPMRLQITFLELDAEDTIRDSQTQRFVPQAVISGIAERAVSHVVYDMGLENDQARLFDRPLRLSKQRGRTREWSRQLAQGVDWELEELLSEAGPELAIRVSRRQIEEEIKTLIKKVTIPDRLEGRRLIQARERAQSEGRLSRIRDVGGQCILVGHLDEEERFTITSSWESDWTQANQHCRQINGLRLWRCGGAVFGLGDHHHDGLSIA